MIVMLILLFLTVPVPVHAEITMSEIYPAPSEGLEWVEICNNSSERTSLAGYSIVDGTGKSIFVPQITLEPNQYILATSSGILNNSGDSVSLRKEGVIIESMTYSSSLTHLQSLVSCDGVWTITTDVTPGFQSTTCGISPSAKPSISTLLTAQSPTPTQVKTYPKTTNTPQSPTALPLPTVLTVPTPQLFSTKHAPVLTSIPTVTPTLHPTPIALRTEHPQKHPWQIIATSSVILCIGATGYFAYHLAHKIKHSYNKIHDP